MTMTRTWTLALALILAAPLVLLAGCQSEPSARQEVAPASATAATSTASSASTGSAACYDPTMSTVCQRACAAKVAYQETDVASQPGANNGDLTRCVVSGVVFKVGEESSKVEHAGNSYFVCCNCCAKKFREEPTRFIRS